MSNVRSVLNRLSKSVIGIDKVDVDVRGVRASDVGAVSLERRL